MRGYTNPGRLTAVRARGFRGLKTSDEWSQWQITRGRSWNGLLRRDCSAFLLMSCLILQPPSHRHLIKTQLSLTSMMKKVVLSMFVLTWTVHFCWSWRMRECHSYGPSTQQRALKLQRFSPFTLNGVTSRFAELHCGSEA